MMEMLQAAGSRGQQCALRRCFLPESSAGKRLSGLRRAVIEPEWKPVWQPGREKVGSVRAVLWAGGLGSDLPEPNRLRQRVDAEAIIGLQCEADKAKMWPTITIANTHSLFVNDGFPPLIPIYWGFFRPMSGSKNRLADAAP